MRNGKGWGRGKGGARRHEVDGMGDAGPDHGGGAGELTEIMRRAVNFWKVLEQNTGWMRAYRRKVVKWIREGAMGK
jgi:hypothetical protein